MAETPEEKPDTVSRSLKVDLRLPQELQEQRQRIISSIRQYRAALRHNFGILCEAQDAGADIVWKDDEVRINPDNHAARVIAALGTRQGTLIRQSPPESGRVRGEGDVYTVQIPRGPVYELKAELVRQMPTMMAFVIDSARRDIQTVWAARDPSIPKATRGWLTLQGARGSARFQRRGIGLPVSTAQPKLEGRELRLKWDHSLGAIPFALEDMDRSRWHVWRCIADGDDGWKLGTIFLTENDGKISAILSHHCPADLRDVDPTRKLTATILQGDPDTLIRFSGPDGAATYDAIDIHGVRAFLACSYARRMELEKRRGANGSPRRPWGFRKGWEVAQETLDRHTLQRTRTVTDHNHAWSRRLVSRAVSWRCGVIELSPYPKASFNGGIPVGAIGGYMWNFGQLIDFVKYKATEYGIAVVIPEPSAATSPV